MLQSIQAEGFEGRMGIQSIWGPYHNIPEAIFYLFKGHYSIRDPKVVLGGSLHLVSLPS